MQAELTIDDQRIFERRYYEALRHKALARKIGEVSLKANAGDELQILEKRRYDEITSGLAEALPGIVKTHYTFEPVDSKLVAEDGQATEDLLINGLRDAIYKASQDNFFAPFLPARARHELDELREQEAMIREQASFNTIVTFSPYSQEYDSDQTRHKLKEAAQEPEQKRAMIRISHWDGARLHVFTRSIDNCDISLLSQTAQRSLGYDFKSKNSTQMLGERLHMKIKDDSWLTQADSLVVHADKLLGERKGGQWLQGRPVSEAEDTQQYVQSQTVIIQNLLGLDRKIAESAPNFKEYKDAFDQLAYNHVALLKERLKQVTAEPIFDIELAASSAGSMARASGEVFNMCGYVLDPGNKQNQVAIQTGFESLKRLEGKKVSCPECKSKVVIPKKNLEAGILTCSDCGYGVEVCTGRRLSKPKPKTNRVKQADFVETLIATLKQDMQRYEMEGAKKAA
ncbi:MAG: hypothetical protein WD877_00415 [Candidatus Saccharimonadales bacterium]